MPYIITKVVIDMTAPDLMSPTAIIYQEIEEYDGPVAQLKKGREQAAQAAQLQAQAAQQQAGLVPYQEALYQRQIQQMNEQNALAQQQETAAEAVQHQQMQLAAEEEQRAAEQYAAKKGLIANDLSYMSGLQPELDKLKSAPGSLSPAAQAQYDADLRNINSTYRNAQQAGFAQLGYRGGVAPGGAFASVVNAGNLARANQQANAFDTGQQNTAQQNLQALQGEMNLANMKNSLINAYNPQGDYALVNSSLNGAGGMTGGLSGASNTLRGGSESLSGASGSIQGANSALAGSANSAAGEANTAQIMHNIGNTFGDVMGGLAGLGGMVAAPFTGGASLAIPGLINSGFNALRNRFAPTNISSFGTASLPGSLSLTNAGAYT